MTTKIISGAANAATKIFCFFVLTCAFVQTATTAADNAADTSFLKNQPGVQVLVPMASGPTAEPWRYTTQKPANDWQSLQFDDSKWKTSPGPFGDGRQFIGPWRTAWQGPDIWLRHTFRLDALPKGRLLVQMFHDEDVELFLNGKSVLSRNGYVTAPILVPLKATITSVLQPGDNVLAVHCHQSRGGQGIDVGLALVGDPNHPLLRRAQRTRGRAPSIKLAAAPDQRTDGDQLATRWAKDVTPENVWSEYPRPALVRDRWLNLNGLWDYAIVGPAKMPRPANLINADADLLLQSEVNPPSAWDGKILVPFAPESILSRVSRFVWPSQLLWYRRSFELPRDWRSGRVLMHFEAVDWHCIVSVNGRKVGEHKGGYTPFTCDITDALKPQSVQRITVVVWDPTNAGDQSVGKQTLPSGRGELRYPPTSGIWQTVWLEPVPVVSIDRLVLTPDVDGSQVVCQAQLRGDPRGCQLEVSALDGQCLIGGAVGGAADKITVKIPQTKLWSPETPFLYDVTAMLRKDGKVVDKITSYFGMRKVAVHRDAAGLPRIMLNNKPIFLFGPLDQGIWPDGILTPPSDAAGRFEVQYLKDIGCNMARFHIIVHPERWYYWCDKLGLIVFQDFVRKRPKDSPTDSSTARQWETEQRELMDHLRNHPALLLWYVFNEGWGQYDTERITRWAMQYDPTRLVCNATGWVDYPVGHTFDIHDYSYHPSVAVPGQTVDRAVMIGECGGFNVFVPDHTTGAYPPAHNFVPTGDDFRPTFWDGAIGRTVWRLGRWLVAVARRGAMWGDLYTDLRHRR